jgi:hypothetical protein
LSQINADGGDGELMRPAGPVSVAFRRLREAGLRPTRQRHALAQLLLENGDRHVTAEQLHEEAVTSGIAVSLTTVYNMLHYIIVRIRPGGVVNCNNSNS